MKILITGGTGSVGEELVKKFANQYGGESVVFTYHNNISKAGELSRLYGCRGIRTEDIEKDYDIIINNAGIVNSLVPCESIRLEDWEETMKINLTLPFTVIQKNLGHMKAVGWGRIINISSTYGVVAEEDVTPYTVSKHGLIGLTKSVAKEYAQYGITCNAICPGTIVSNLSGRLADYYTRNEEEREVYFQELKDAIPARRLVYPHEVADFALFIAGEEAAYINGATLMIDGGYTV